MLAATPVRAKSWPYVGQSVPGCPTLFCEGEVSVLDGGAESVGVAPRDEPAQPAAAARTPAVGAADASLAMRASLVRITPVSPKAPRPPAWVGLVDDAMPDPAGLG